MLPDNVEDVSALACLATGTTDRTKTIRDDFKRASASSPRSKRKKAGF